MPTYGKKKANKIQDEVPDLINQLVVPGFFLIVCLLAVWALVPELKERVPFIGLIIGAAVPRIRAGRNRKQEAKEDDEETDGNSKPPGSGEGGE